MALQTANQFQLGTDFSRLGSGIQQGQQIANQFQIGQQNEQKLDDTAEESRIMSVVQGASEIVNLPDDASKLNALYNRKQKLIQQGKPTQDTDEVISMFEAGDSKGANGLIQGAVNMGVQTGRIKAPAGAAPGFSLGQGQKRFDAAGNEIASVDPKPEGVNQTTIEKQLVAAGFTPGTPEFQAEVLKSIQKPVGTQINIGGEKKFQEEVQKSQAATYAKVGEDADSAIDANQSLSVLESIDVDTGALEPAKQGIAAFASAFGIDASGIANISKGESFNAEAKRIVLAVKASQKGPQTDRDEFTIRETVANLGNTKAGNQFIIDSARALNNRRIERKEFYDRYIEENGGNFKDESGRTADRAWADFKRNTPLISTKLRTPEGLPVFFYKFEQDVRQLNPDASKAEIIEAWNAQNKRAK